MLIDVTAQPVSRDGHSYLRIKVPARIANLFAANRLMTTQVDALWDTGATNTSIPMGTAIALGLPLREETDAYMATSEGTACYCSFHIIFPDGRGLVVKEGNAVPGLNSPLIIGMDIISQGITTITPLPGGAVRLTFDLM